MERLAYALCAATAVLTAALLLRGFVRTRHRLLLWSGLSFVGFAANNLLLVADRLVFTEVDLSTWRLLSGLVAVLVLLCALVLDQPRPEE